jgi:hypothetical protein
VRALAMIAVLFESLLMTLGEAAQNSGDRKVGRRKLRVIPTYLGVLFGFDGRRIEPGNRHAAEVSRKLLNETLVYL